MVLEQTLNRDSKIKGGIIGVAQDNSSVEKWTLTSHLRSAVKSNLFSLPTKHLNDPTLEKKNDKVKINKMTDDILKVFNDRNLNPFIIDATTDEATPLMNVVTGVVLGHPKSDKLLNAKQIGQDELKKLVSK